MSVLSVHNTVAVSMLNISIKLDHFSGLPYEDIQALYKRIRSNIFSVDTLRVLVIENLLMYQIPPSMRQKVLTLLGIEVLQKYPSIIDLSSKKLIK